MYLHTYIHTLNSPTWTSILVSRGVPALVLGVIVGIVTVTIIIVVVVIIIITHSILRVTTIRSHRRAAPRVLIQAHVCKAVADAVDAEAAIIVMIYTIFTVAKRPVDCGA
jgi:hypothetical protein